MAATMLSSMLATTHCFPSQNPNRGSGNRKSCRSSSSPACFYPSTVRYQDRFSAFRLSTFPSFCAIRGHLYRMGARRSTSRIFLPHLVASMEEVEETYVMVKPDGVQRGLVGDIISRFEKKGFLLKGLKLFQCPKELAEAWEGIGVVASARKLIGATNPLQADPGTIRGDLAVQTGRNVVHGSDSPDNGHREIDLWFKQDELCEWVPAQEPWLKE
ncbi:hypothetical protein KFK09_012148 [Dendrobium nobile]|uniref:Nucleoside diphosphate kinase n=1 Tax=Dendrobium nobile TaxID=94219 RepID=A0A8T3BK00_DENNO|nr:hypothetical protein KFK09_012148 [Dendrobium nobile]